MQCIYCNNENPDESKFCFNCGKSLAETPELDPQELNTPEIPPVNLKTTTQTKLILATIAIIVIGMLAYKYFTKPLPPDQIAAKYMEALKAGDLSQAYAYLDDSSFIGREFLTEDCFKKAFGSQKVTEYELSTQAYGENPQNEQITRTAIHYIQNSGGERQEGDLILVNHPEGKKANWKIDPSTFIVGTDISTMPGVTVKIDDQQFKFENGSDTLSMFRNYAFTAYFEHPDCQTLKVYATAGQYVNGTDLEVSLELQDIIRSQFNEFLNAIVQAAKDCDMSHYSKAVKPGSHVWVENENWISSVRDRSKNEMNQEEKISEPRINKIYFDYEFKDLYADVEWFEEAILTNQEGNVVNTASRQKSCELIFEKQENGSWLITGERK